MIVWIKSPPINGVAAPLLLATIINFKLLRNLIPLFNSTLFNLGAEILQ